MENVDGMAPFLMNVVSDCDLWMFLSSRGGLTAGRESAEGAVFPYETDDRLHQAHLHTGPYTRIRFAEPSLAEWTPFIPPLMKGFERRLYKSVFGNSVIFEERHLRAQMTFRYRWSSSDRYGIVRSVSLRNHGSSSRRLHVLDGMRNILPHGVELRSWQSASNLVNAYRRSEIDDELPLGYYTLESLLTDKAEPAESLRATVVWSVGCDPQTVRVKIHGSFSGTCVTGEPGDYCVENRMVLSPNEESKWQIVMDAGKNHADICALRKELRDPAALQKSLEGDIQQGTQKLKKLLSSIDGLQRSKDQVANAHHVANALFNGMRGGIFVENYQVEREDFVRFASTRNRDCLDYDSDFWDSLPESVAHPTLLRLANDAGNPNLIRLALEYLPLTFSRRHGDPSRPWNRFHIRVRDNQGKPVLAYEGNWRDIFQNWDALCLAFPHFIGPVVAKFLNASTTDGHNPYRITDHGVDWEVPVDDDPWSHIGYWGDHQIVYLGRLLERWRTIDENEVLQQLVSPIYSYTEIPYRIRNYDELVRDPKNTIDFDKDRNKLLEERRGEVGADGVLVQDQNGDIVHVTLLEKLLVSVLGKLSNFIPDAGIWMNTQRPEWNDAQNALVGQGASVVTLCHLRKFLSDFENLLDRRSDDECMVSDAVLQWFEAVSNAFSDSLREPTFNGGIHSETLLNEHPRSEDRRAFLSKVGEAAALYRQKVYGEGLGARCSLRIQSVRDFCRDASAALHLSIENNARADGLRHSYNTVRFTADGRGLEIQRLPEMLEGQVAYLDSGDIEPDSLGQLVDALYASQLYRADQKSFLLQPPARPPSFLRKNTFADDRIRGNRLLETLRNEGERSVIQDDPDGNLHFHPDLVNRRALLGRLNSLEADPRWTVLVEKHRADTLALYEDVFSHRSFTGRSGSMYGYEGLGCIYWHQVSKLLLAVQKIALKNADGDDWPALAAMYERIREGLGATKSPVLHGAFPTDPYSHTPAHAGAQQPGMTGQVKEGVLLRFGELGVGLVEGELVFEPRFLRHDEFLTEQTQWDVVTVDGTMRRIKLSAGSLGFTYCQVPVIYRPVEGPCAMRVCDAHGNMRAMDGNRLPADLSAKILRRDGDVAHVEVDFPLAWIRPGQKSVVI